MQFYSRVSHFARHSSNHSVQEKYVIPIYKKLGFPYFQSFPASSEQIWPRNLLYFFNNFWKCFVFLAQAAETEDDAGKLWKLGKPSFYILEWHIFWTERFDENHGKWDTLVFMYGKWCRNFHVQLDSFSLKEFNFISKVALLVSLSQIYIICIVIFSNNLFITTFFFYFFLGGGLIET